MSVTRNPFARVGRTPDITEARAALADTTVLVTGAGGAVGSALVKELLHSSTCRVAALDMNEHALVDLLAEIPPDRRRNLQEMVGNVRDVALTRRRLEEFRPDIVFHAAGLRRRELRGRHSGEYVLTNLMGARNVIDAATEAGVGMVVLISSCESASPQNVIFASERLAELYGLGVNAYGTARRPRIVSVRAGRRLFAGTVMGPFRPDIAANNEYPPFQPTSPVASANQVARSVLVATALSLKTDHACLALDPVAGIRPVARRFRRPPTGEEIAGLEALAKEGCDEALRINLFGLYRDCAASPPSSLEPNEHLHERERSLPLGASETSNAP